MLVEPGSEEALDRLAAVRGDDPGADPPLVDDDERRHGVDLEALVQLGVVLGRDPV
jgi:hypothetical protein